YDRVRHSFYFLFSILLPPLRSTLFPYTTLFRSNPLPVDRRNAGSDLVLVPWRETAVSGSGKGEAAKPETRNIKLAATIDVDAVIDRKSTRLNSSHVAISYAVFCLKKKKYTRQHV